MVARFDETAGTEVFGERKNVPFRGRQGIEPAATFVDDDDDISVTAILDGASGAFLDVDLPAIFLQQGCAADLLAQLFDFSFVHLSAPDSRRRLPAPSSVGLTCSKLPGTSSTGREACRMQGRADQTVSRRIVGRGEASLAAGLAPAAAGHPAQ